MVRPLVSLTRPTALAYRRRVAARVVTFTSGVTTPRSSACTLARRWHHRHLHHHRHRYLGQAGHSLMALLRTSARTLKEPPQQQSDSFHTSFIACLSRLVRR